MLSEDGYIGMEIRPRGTNTDIVLRVTRPQSIVGEKGRKIRELKALVQRKFEYDPEKLRIFVNPVDNRALSASSQCESLRYKLLNGVAVRRACYSILNSVMENKGRGVEVIVSGKIRGQRAKSLKLNKGVMIHAGKPAQLNVDFSTKKVQLKQGILGIKVKINKSPDPDQLENSSYGLPDRVIVPDCKDEIKEVFPRIEVHKDDKEPEHEITQSRGVPQERRYDYRSNYREYGSRHSYADRQPREVIITSPAPTNQE